MGFKVVMTAEEFLRRQIDLADNHDTCYRNSYPYNLLYRQAEDLYSSDCWNEIKAMLSGFTPDEPIGTFTHIDYSIGLGDWNGWTILQCCNEISTDLHTCIPSEYLLSSNKDHAGTFIGERVINGKTYNVLESTSDWAGGFQYSWMDYETGYRYKFKGYPYRMKTVWKWHGKLPWLDYGVHNAVAVDGWWGMDVTRHLQKMHGTEIDGEISGQSIFNKRYLVNASKASWSFGIFTGGSDLIRAMQKDLTEKGFYADRIDGACGKNTIKAIQAWLKALGYYADDVDGYLGYNTVCALQNYINDWYKENA